MSLAEKDWRRVSIHQIVLAWLRAERNTRVANWLASLPSDNKWEARLSSLLDQANINDAEENRARLRLLYLIRSPFVVEIPPDTKWYEVRNLTDGELGQLHVVNYGDWKSPGDKNELAKVAARKKLELQQAPATWEPPILWGHEKEGPFTIIEGNNRLTAYVGSGETDLDIAVFVGLSPLRCVWHIHDKCGFLMHDLFAR